MTPEQETAFWDIIEVFDLEGVTHKLLINPLRATDEKREKDIRSVEVLLMHTDMARLRQVIEELPKKDIQTLKEVCEKNAIRI